MFFITDVSNNSDCLERVVHFQCHFPKSASMGGPLISRTLREISQGLLVRSLLKMTYCRVDLTEGRCHALVDATLVRGQEFAKVLRVSTKIR